MQQILKTQNTKHTGPAMHLKSLTAIIVSIGFANGCATSQPSTLKATVSEYGLYTRGVERIYADPLAPSGQSRGSSGFKHAKTTGVIPLAMGTSFGFCYEISGFLSAATSEVVIRKSHPALAKPGQPPITSHQTRRTLVARDGKISDCVGYGFDHAFELVPGVWRFTVVVDGSDMLSQEFVAQ